MSQSPRRGLPASIGPYAIERELGRGGMGVVFGARDAQGRTVAVKVLASLSGSGERARRFKREGDVLATLDHPNVVKFLGASPGPPPWLAMEFVEGKELGRLLADEAPLDPERAAKILAGVARGVAHAHEHGVVHRDLKPANVLLRRDGTPVVTDFGLAKDLDASTLTQAGTSMGTILYMAPEQLADSSRAGPPADVWALGVILYEALTGVRPFEGASPVALIAAIEAGKFTTPRRKSREVPEHLDFLVVACLAKDPARRPTAAALADALESDAPLETRRAPVLAVAAALVLVVSGGAFALLRSKPVPSGPSVEPTAPPWPAADASWRLAWSLASGAAPELRPKPLWVDAKVADPWRGITATDAGAAQAAWCGGARRTQDGTVAVDYDLARALRAVPVRSALYVANATRGAGKLVAGDLDGALPALELEAPDNAGAIHVLVGRGAWRGARVTARLALARPIDGCDLTLVVGAPSGPELVLYGRAATASIGEARAAFRFADGFEEVVLAPGAPEGQRVRIDGAPVPALDAAVVKAAPDGVVDLRAAEGHWAFSRVHVEGAPLRGDVAATAWAPPALPARARVAAAFAVEGPATEGGPFVTLGAPDKDGLVLGLEGSRLVLAHGDSVLASRDLAAAPTEGWLLLERQGEVLRGVLHAGAAETVVEVAEPLPLAASPVRAGYGSSAPRTTFAAVELHQATAPSRAPEVEDAARRWREAALALAQVADPMLAADDALGAAATELRASRAAEAANALVAAAEKLPPLLARDARARALRASVVAGDEAAAASLAQRLIADEGLDAARARVDGLERDLGRPLFVARLVDGYEVAGAFPRIARAACAAAELLAPDRRAAVIFNRALALRDSIRIERVTDAAEATRRLEEARTLMEQARSLGFDTVRVDECTGPIATDLGRHEEARAAWERVVLVKPHFWYAWMRLAEANAALGQVPAALEATLGICATAPGRGLDQLKALAERVATDRTHQGLAAAAFLVLDQAGAGGARRAALELAGRASGVPRDEDLAAYVRTRLGERTEPPAGARPTRDLALAAAAPPEDAAKLLKTAAERDPLVRHLARLDPALAPLLDR